MAPYIFDNNNSHSIKNSPRLAVTRCRVGTNRPVRNMSRTVDPVTSKVPIKTQFYLKISQLGSMEIFIDIKSFRSHYGPGVYSAQWLRCCATNRKVAGSIPDGVIGIFH
jgi:hypothetical protein